MVDLTLKSMRDLRGVQAVQDRWRDMPPNVRGALWILLSTLMFSTMGALIKTLGARLDSFQIVWFRCLFGLFAVLPFLVHGGWHTVRTNRLGLHLWRSVLGMTAMSCGFYAITHMALADAVAISFTKPLFVIVLAVILLGETVNLKRWAATVVGFGGVLIMVQPGGESFDWVALIAVFGAFAVSLNKIVIKQLAATESATTILFYFGVFASLLTLGPALLVWQTPTWTELIMLFAMGGVGALAQVCTIRGLRIGEATAVMPFDYTRLLFAGLFGFFLFGEVPGLWSLAGAALIVASTFVITHIETRARRGQG